MKHKYQEVLTLLFLVLLRSFYVFQIEASYFICVHGLSPPKAGFKKINPGHRDDEIFIAWVVGDFPNGEFVRQIRGGGRWGFTEAEYKCRKLAIKT